MSRALAFAALLAAAGTAHGFTQAPFTLLQAIPLPGVSGRIDHLAVDLAGSRLFVAALGNDSVEVVDLKSGSVIHHITGLSEPQGVAYLAGPQKLYVANGGTGVLDVFDGKTLERAGRIDLGGDADNLHFDKESGRLFVSAGDGLSVIDPATDVRSGQVGVGGHPEGFALSRGARRIFANVPFSARKVVVVDGGSLEVQAQWQAGAVMGNFFSNFPLSLDEADGRVFVGTRVPARLKVMDSATGAVIADVGIDGDPDDIFYDEKRGAIYVSCGSGYLDVIARTQDDHYRPVVRMATASGARTSLWVPELDRLFVAVPRNGSRGAEILIYQPAVK
jgi:YVTN family beta-propeller protein